MTAQDFATELAVELSKTKRYSQRWGSVSRQTQGLGGCSRPWMVVLRQPGRKMDQVYFTYTFEGGVDAVERHASQELAGQEYEVVG